MSFHGQIKSLTELLKSLDNNNDVLKNIETSIEMLNSAINNNFPILVFGNGGSASDALHIAGELVGRFLLERKPINVICLNSNVSVLTAWANDYDYDTVFSRQVEAHASEGGICWGISTSGNSENVVAAFNVAKRLKMKTLSLTGFNGGKLKNLSDVSINVPSNSTPRIQELHLPIYHYICEHLEVKIAKK